ncbi:MAG: zinc-binding dehydrogenase [Rhizobiales bacterium]|nr:zinc-binding dehydrogenase [Hyphomicrobiales bacterium]
MRVLQLTDDYGIDKLQLVEQDRPKPGHGEILIALKHASLNYRDLATISGFMGKLPAPFIPLSDAAGEVVEVGEGVTRFKAGDKVCPGFFPTWLSGPPTQAVLSRALGGSLNGVACEYICLPQTGASLVPKNLSLAEASTLPCAGLTAWRALVVEGDIKAGDTVLVQGTGGVSIFALQFAKAAGARVIATSSSDEKLEQARKLGADETINYKSTPKWGKEARRLTGGLGVDHVVEVGGAGTLEESLQATRVNGHIAMIGILSGLSSNLSMAAVFSNNLRIKGISVGSIAQFEEMSRAIEANDLHPVIDCHFPFEKTGDALAHMQAGKHLGKVVIDIA